ncbi:MAG TPA: tetratricopeptide repeat protein [Rhodocyclaceae bacterium]|nr:tetratricopeptide repeat protein [Rhodocyclaceae bacterium]
MKRTVNVDLLAITFAMFMAASYCVGAQAQEIQMGIDCPSMEGYGPFDYRAISESTRVLVEGAHFTPDVEHLIHGKHSYIGGDIDYTLRAFPNSPRALMAMMRLFDQQKGGGIPDGAKPLHCYFENALIFKPNDGTVHLLYGMFLLKKKDQDKAIEQFEKAATLSENDPNIYYNLGLAYFGMQKYDLALTNAHKAYAEGFPLPGLRDMLKRVGQWKDAPPPVAEASAPQASPAPTAESATAK